jgi:hypothetical protein
MDEMPREMYRARWRRERERLGVSDISQQDFAKAAIARFVPNLTVRFVVLGADPDREWIDFDPDFWSWWKTNQASPFDAAPEEWGSTMPTTNAAVRRRPFSNDPWSWDSYIALYRHGGLDVGLGRDGAVPLNEKRRIFFLLRIVGRIWTALHLYSECIKHLNIEGPWECSLALLGTKDALLGNFASGWAPYNDPYANPVPCQEQNLWWRREIDNWPSPDGMRDLAFRVGAWIEDSWGMSSRRFLAHNGPLAGKFDVITYRNSSR